MIDAVRSPESTDDQPTEGNGKIQFLGGPDPVSFGEFLRAEKERRGVPWEDLEMLCGCHLRRYAPVDPETRVINPPKDRFEQIVAALGFTASDFVYGGLRSTVQHVPERGTSDYWDHLKRLGSAIVLKNEQLAAAHRAPQRLSVTVIEAVLSKQFAHVHGRDVERRLQLLSDLHTLPGCGTIQLQIQVQMRQEQDHPLSALEWYFLRDAFQRVCGAQSEAVHAWDRLPRGSVQAIYDLMQQRRSEVIRDVPEGGDLVKERSLDSIRHHLNQMRSRLRGPLQRKRPLQGSPQPNVDLQSVVSEGACIMEQR